MNIDSIRSVQNWFDSQYEAMVELLQTLVEHETPSGDVPRINALQDILTKLFAEAGGRVERITAPTGDHLRVSFFAEDGPPTLALCHVDTVWNVGAFPGGQWRVDEKGIARGPGAFDMKGGIVALLFALRGLKPLPDTTGVRPLVVLLTADEEVGSPTSRALIEQEAQGVAQVLVLESPLPGGVLKTGRKGVGTFRLTITGRAAHAGVEPEKGISAVQELAHQIQAIHALNDPAKGTTVNVGVVTGGTRSNVVAAEARAEIDVRVKTLSEAERVTMALLNLKPVHPEALVRVEGNLNRPPFERNAAIAGLFAQASTIAQALGLPPLTDGATGGGSDGNFTAALGLPTLDGLGPDGAGAHAASEQVILASLPQRAYLLAGLLVGL